jgi:hypothetical protein
MLFICKTKSRLRRRHCGLERHFKTDPTETVALCFGYAKTLFWRRWHCGLARHFKTDPTKTVALCFGYAKTTCWRADGRADEQDMCQLDRWRGYKCNPCFLSFFCTTLSWKFSFSSVLFALTQIAFVHPYPLHLASLHIWRSSSKWYTVNSIWKHSVFAYPKRERYCFNRFCFKMAHQIN